MRERTEAPLRAASPALGLEHYRKAARWRRVHPWANARTSERPYGGAVTPGDHGSPLRGTGPGGRKEGVLAPARPRSRRGGVQRRRRLLPAKGRRRSVLRKEKEKKERRGGDWTGSSSGVPRWRRRPRWPVAMGGRRCAAPRKGREKAKLGLRGAGGSFDPAKLADDRRIQSDGRERPAPERAEFSPGWGGVSRPRPRLWPGTRVRRAPEQASGRFRLLGHMRRGGQLGCVHRNGHMHSNI